MSESNAQSVVNGTNVPVTFHGGRSGIVVLKRLSIRKLYHFVEYVTTDKSPELVALCAEQPIEWIDLLTEESYAELLTVCIKANFTRAMKIAQSDPVMAIKILPLLQGMEKLSKLVSATSAAGGPNTKTSSPEPVPAESAAETGSA